MTSRADEKNETREELIQSIKENYGQWAVDIVNKFIDDPEETPYEERKRLAKVDKAFDD